MSKLWKNLRAVRLILALLSFAFQTGRLQGAEDWTDTLSTDRPDLADSAGTVGAGRLQLESGFQRTGDASGAVFSLPLLLRVGVGDRLEARISTDGPSLSDAGGPLNGFQNVGLGAKWTFLSQEGNTFEALGLLGEAGFQDAGSGLALADLSLVFAMDLSFPGDAGLGINLGMTEQDPSGTAQRDGSWAASFGFPLSQRWAGYLENSGVLPGVGDATVGFDGGLKFLVTPDLQLDASFGDFFTGSTSQTTLALGCSFRFGGSSTTSNDKKEN
jgi:hypothetical protein